MKNKKKTKIKNRIINIFKEVMLFIVIIFSVVFIALSLGLALVVFDCVKQEECDDWMLMEKWKQKEEKEKLRIEDKSINVSVWTPKIEKEGNKK